MTFPEALANFRNDRNPTDPPGARALDKSTNIHIAAALITREDGGALLVRKRGTLAFMQPGGKIGSGETPAQALIRELEEELGLRTSSELLQPLGDFEAPAAHEPWVYREGGAFSLGRRRCSGTRCRD